MSIGLLKAAREESWKDDVVWQAGVLGGDRELSPGGGGGVGRYDERG